MLIGYEIAVLRVNLTTLNSTQLDQLDARRNSLRFSVRAPLRVSRFAARSRDSDLKFWYDCIKAISFRRTGRCNRQHEK